MAVKDVTDADFAAAVLRADLPVLVDFWARWCGPCRLVAPLMDWAGGAYGDRLLVMKMEVDPNPVTRDQYKVQGIPSLLVFRGGEVIARHEGALSQKQLKAFLDAHL
ncbi:MAG: thiol reductase thioredoxin [Synechococcus sp. SB0662_bin_45]|uniref:Thioredoxin n=1 Tax=Synechococcus sp. SB0676_bin_10 TaxID=2604869 RepID=A0A6B1F3L6_9SYNE|nr:thioredoxin domain-containing protein [Cyanobacteria bacterium MAG IRC3_bin_20]MDE0648244.1 thioredoxin domain-containing protein [Cyanobacteria bacterium MAG IRC4_bin_6]MXW13281.1 thiol reductase thioredoxin [Synechococcus sp. SB0668_bin_13]MXX08733.1 thiol reductase thioredoxin [Synechococcus sp. SB0667_bin_8]MXY19687.1 thiol reductase thioredoxin [Synechococcus sp. SB0664_bin_36]MYE21961.1 thiol reductase thioredoxin [Synechococcus sp. SB0662_bin_45]MYG37920.1 thiol reductase thioredoxi